MNMFSHNCGKVSFDLVFKNMTKFTVLPVSYQQVHHMSQHKAMCGTHNTQQHRQLTAMVMTMLVWSKAVMERTGCPCATNVLNFSCRLIPCTHPAESPMYTCPRPPAVHVTSAPCSIRCQVTEELLNHFSAQFRNGGFKTHTHMVETQDTNKYFHYIHTHITKTHLSN